MTQTAAIQRPPNTLIEGLKQIGSATASGKLAELGIRDSQIRGPVGWTPDVTMVGPALTLQFMPKREDQYNDGEYSDPEKQLHRHVLYHTQPGDIVVVDARGDMASGVFGEMMLTYFKGQGGLGVVVDGCIRDYPTAKSLGLGIWIKGVTPNYHTQTNIFPFAVNVPIACGERLVLPGDIIVADEDGVIVVPINLAPKLLDLANTQHEWEIFSKQMLEEGGDLRKYYPLREDAKAEYEVWKAKQNKVKRNEVKQNKSKQTQPNQKAKTKL
ncbi:MAG: ribonuclease activity regulator RraA [Trueperaceae bacterium]